MNKFFAIVCTFVCTTEAVAVEVPTIDWSKADGEYTLLVNDLRVTEELILDVRRNPDGSPYLMAKQVKGIKITLKPAEANKPLFPYVIPVVGTGIDDMALLKEVKSFHVFFDRKNGKYLVTGFNEKGRSILVHEMKITVPSAEPPPQPDKKKKEEEKKSRGRINTGPMLASTHRSLQKTPVRAPHWCSAGVLKFHKE
jgi:hypothetical protein